MAKIGASGENQCVCGDHAPGRKEGTSPSEQFGPPRQFGNFVPLVKQILIRPGRAADLRIEAEAAPADVCRRADTPRPASIRHLIRSSTWPCNCRHSKKSATVPAWMWRKTLLPSENRQSGSSGGAYGRQLACKNRQHPLFLPAARHDARPHGRPFNDRTVKRPAPGMIAHMQAALGMTAHMQAAPGMIAHMQAALVRQPLFFYTRRTGKSGTPASRVLCHHMRREGLHISVCTCQSAQGQSAQGQSAR